MPALPTVVATLETEYSRLMTESIHRTRKLSLIPAPIFRFGITMDSMDNRV